jgi:hypothetical protein
VAPSAPQASSPARWNSNTSARCRPISRKQSGSHFSSQADLRVAREIQMGMIPHDFSGLEKDFGVKLAAGPRSGARGRRRFLLRFAAESGPARADHRRTSPGKASPHHSSWSRASTLARLLAGQIREPERLLAALNDQLAAERIRR